MIIDKQQEALLFTLTFEQLDRLYGGVELTALEEELFRRVNEMDSEQKNVDSILYNYGMHIETLESDIESVMETIRDLEAHRDNLKEELEEKEEEIDNLKYEIKQLHTNTNSESEF